MMINFSHLEEIVGGKILLLSKDDSIHTLCIDSRKATEKAGRFFLQLKVNGMMAIYISIHSTLQVFVSLWLNDLFLT